VTRGNSTILVKYTTDNVNLLLRFIEADMVFILGASNGKLIKVYTCPISEVENSFPNCFHCLWVLCFKI